MRRCTELHRTTRLGQDDQRDHGFSELPPSTEHKFPTAPNDAYAAYLWSTQHAKEFNGEPMRVAVGGESAGSNLATVESMMARDKKAQMPVHQLLVYPVVNNDMNNASYRGNPNAKPLNKPMMA